MTAVELIGFVAGVLMLLFSIGRSLLEEWRRQQAVIQEEIKEYFPEIAPAKKPPKPTNASKKKAAALPSVQAEGRRTLSDDFTYQASLDKRRRQVNAIESRKFETKVGQRLGEGYGDTLVSKELVRKKVVQKKMVRLLPGGNLRSMILGKEILSLPVGMRDEPLC